MCVEDANGDRYQSAPIDHYRDAEEACTLIQGAWIEPCESTT